MSVSVQSAADGFPLHGEWYLDLESFSPFSKIEPEVLVPPSHAQHYI